MEIVLVKIVLGYEGGCTRNLMKAAVLLAPLGITIKGGPRLRTNIHVQWARAFKCALPNGVHVLALCKLLGDTSLEAMFYTMV